MAIFPHGKPWARLHHWIEKWCFRIFYSLGKGVSTRRWLTLLLCFAFALICSLGFLNATFVTETSKLWVPAKSTAKNHQAVVDEHFGRGGKTASILISALNPSTNMLTMDYLDQIWDVYESALAIHTSTGSAYEDVCARPTPADLCSVMGILKFWGNDLGTYESQVSSDDDILKAVSSSTFPDGTPVFLRSFLGNYILDDAGLVKSAEAAIIFMAVDELKDDAHDYFTVFERSMTEISNDIGDDLTAYYKTDESIDRELENTMTSEVLLSMLTYALMTFFVMVALVKKPYSLVNMRSGLAFSAVLTVLLSGFSGYGICAGFGVPLSTMNSVLPFILLAIGVDDSFVLMGALDSTDPALPTEERIALALSRCGMSIAYTTLTDFLAFILGATSSLPAVSYFCIYAAVSIFVDFLLQVTFFVQFMAWDVDRRKAQRIDCCCCLVRGQATPEGKDVEQEAPGGMEQPEDGAKDAPLQTSLLGEWMGSKLVPAILSPMGKCAVFVAAISFFALGLVGCMHVTQGFDVLDTTQDGSFLHDYLSAARSLGISGGDDTLPIGIYWQDLNVTSTDVQQMMLHVEQDALKLSHSEGPLDSWIDDFLLWASREKQFSGDINDSGLYASINQFYPALHQFLSEPENERFVSDIIFNEAGDAVVISRSHLWQVDTASAERKKQALSEIRRSLETSPLGSNPFPYAVAYTEYEQYFVLIPELLSNFLLCAFAVFILSLIALGSLRYTLLVMTTLLVVDVEVFGFVWVWGLQISSITSVEIIMAVGLVVDALCHVVHYFMVQDCALRRRERIHAAMAEIGPSVLMGTSTALVGTIPLAFASNEIFRTFFKLMIVIIISGALHGIFFIPVMLDIIPTRQTDNMLHEGKICQPSGTAVPSPSSMYGEQQESEGSWAASVGASAIDE